MSVDGNPKGRIEASVETKLLYQRLKELKPGDEVSYSELSKLVGIDVQGQKGRGYLTSARKMVSSESILIITIWGEGIRHAKDEDVVDDIGKDQRKIRRSALRSSRKPACIKDYESLPSELQIQHNVYLSLLGAIRVATSLKVRRKLTMEVTVGHQAIPLAKTLELFTS